MTQIQSGTTAERTTSRLTRPILIAGIVGGLLGGVASFAAGRFIKPASPEPTSKEQATHDARQIVEAYLDELKAGKKDEFINHVKMGYTYISDSEFNQAKRNFSDSLTIYDGIFGKSLHQFVLLRENALSPDLIKFLYLEKYDHGGVVWTFIMYYGMDQWRLAKVDWNEKLDSAFTGFGP